MLSETIKLRLAERFAAPLPEFHKRRIVFWHDEDGEFTDAIDELDLPGVSIIKLTGTNNFAVKKLLSSDDLTGDYLIYDPLSYEKDQHDDWLLDIKLYSGEPFRADLVSLQMEELLVEPSSAMRKTMKLYAKFLDNKDRKAKLRRIGRTYQTPLQLHIDIVAVLCGLAGSSAQDVFIAVLSMGLEKENNDVLINIEKFGNIEAFWQLVQKYTGYINAEDRPLSDLAAHILITALSQTMPASALRGLERFVSDSCKAYCYQLVHEWQRADGSKSLIEICRHVEHELRLADRFDKTDIYILLKSDTFPAINESILKRFFAEIGENVVKAKDIIIAIENRRTAAWYALTEDYLESLYYIAKMQEFYLAHIDGFHIVEPSKIWRLYTTDAYEMDSHYRHFHYRFGNTLKYPNTLLEDALRNCSDVVEGLYREWFLKQLTLTWTNAIAGDLNSLGYVSEINEQRQFYSRYVSPNVSKGRVYVIISDALRYEVAAELSESLSHNTKGRVTLESVQAVFPSITKFGMAALLPGNEVSVNGKIDVFVDGDPTTSTAQRGAILKAANPSSVAVTYKELLQMNIQERRDLVAGKDIIYIYHNAIDATGDIAPTETKVFEACDTAIDELTAIVKRITGDLSGVNIFITADHGFLYTYKPLEESQKISRQNFYGEVYELGRRYALTATNATANYLLPVKTVRTIGGTPMKGYAPQDTVRIKIQGGGENYVHGGISLQEMVVPVIVYKGMRTGYKKYVEVQNPGLSLISESRKVSNLMFSLDFLQKHSVGEKVQPCNYSLHFINDEGVPVSDFQTVIADRTSNNSSDRVFRVRFTLKQMQYNRNKIYHLVIANDTDAPEEIEFRIDIAFADDFGFGL